MNPMTGWPVAVTGSANEAALCSQVRADDARIVDHLAALHPRVKSAFLQEKAILRRAFAGLLPARIIERRKFAFNTPMAWLFDDLMTLAVPRLVRAHRRERTDRPSTLMATSGKALVYTGYSWRGRSTWTSSKRSCRARSRRSRGSRCLLSSLIGPRRTTLWGRPRCRRRFRPLSSSRGHPRV